MRQRIKFYGALAVFAVAGVLLLPAQAHGQTTTTSTTDGVVYCQALGCPTGPTTTSTSLSIPAGCAVNPCRTSDGNPHDPQQDNDTVAYPNPVVAKFTG